MWLLLEQLIDGLWSSFSGCLCLHGGRGPCPPSRAALNHCVCEGMCPSTPPASPAVPTDPPLHPPAYPPHPQMLAPPCSRIPAPPNHPPNHLHHIIPTQPPHQPKMHKTSGSVLCVCTLMLVLVMQLPPAPPRASLHATAARDPQSLKCMLSDHEFFTKLNVCCPSSRASLA